MEYIQLLMLLYFYKNKQNYTLSSIIKMLGMDSLSFYELLNGMIDNGLLEYKNSILRITEKGICKIESSNISHYDDNDFIMLNINKKEALKLDKIYIPENFIKKL